MGPIKSTDTPSCSYMCQTLYCILGSLLTFAVVAFGSGCRSKEKAPDTVPAPANASATEENQPAHPDAALRPMLSSTETLLKSGAYDEAAAQLVQMRTSGRQFTPQEAVAYRRSLSDAYTRALEAAEKGDPKAKAALQMLRAAGSH